MSYLCFFTSLNNNSSNKNNRNICYEINSDYYEDCGEEYARYGNYCVYVGDKKSVMCHNDDTDIRIIDYRNKKNPNFEICDSYKITDEEEMINIISIISNYSHDFPGDWDRSPDGMKIEWLVHNIAYDLGVLKENSGSVNFDNRDSVIYDNELIKLLFRK